MTTAKPFRVQALSLKSQKKSRMQEAVRVHSAQGLIRLTQILQTRQIKPALLQATELRTHIRRKKQTKNLPKSSIQCRLTASPNIIARATSRAVRFTMLFLEKPIRLKPIICSVKKLTRQMLTMLRHSLAIQMMT